MNSRTLKIIKPMSRRIQTGLAWYWKTIIGCVVGNFSLIFFEFPVFETVRKEIDIKVGCSV